MKITIVYINIYQRYNQISVEAVPPWTWSWLTDCWQDDSASSRGICDHFRSK